MDPFPEREGREQKKKAEYCAGDLAPAECGRLSGVLQHRLCLSGALVNA